MVGGFCGKGKEYRGNDEYYTLKETWALISPFLPKDKIVWEAFYGTGTSATYLRELGFEVVSRDENFFEMNEGDIIVSNPPFSTKKKVLERLFELGKPFCLILPYEVLFYKYLAPFRDSIQLAIPTTRMKFCKDGEVVKFNYDCVFFCWKMGLPKDLLFV